jgi:hypothetical protein
MATRRNPGRHAAVFWALTTAMVFVGLWPMKWWHPGCDVMGEGPNYYAFGAPLPFARPTGASSMEFVFMPHMLVLDLLVVAALAWLAWRPLLGWIGRRHPRASRLLSGVGAAAAVIAAILWLLGLSIGFRPTLLIDEPYYGVHYWDYRPADLMLSAGKPPCTM